MKTIIKNKLKEKISLLLIVAMLISTLQSCVKDNFQFKKIAEVQWDPNVAAPLVYASLSLKDILNNNTTGFIVEASDKSLTLVYKGSLFSLDASDLVNLPDQTLPPFSAAVGADPSLPIPFTTGTFTGSYIQTVSLGTGTSGPLVDSITFKAGILFFSFTSTLHNSGSIVVTIPTAKKNGVAFSQTIAMNYTTGASPAVINPYGLDLSGYNFDMTLGGTSNNQFIIHYDVTLIGSATTPSSTDQITASLSMNNMQFSKIFGDIRQQDLSINTDTINLTIFTNAANSTGGTFSIDNPRVKVTFSNSFGLPIGAHLSTFEGYNPGVNFYPITGFPDPLPIPSPNFSQVGQTLVDSFKLDKTNSNIATIINNTPKEIIYKVDAKSNPAGATHNNFILDTSHFKMDVDFELPLYGTAKNFMMVDTIPFSFTQNVPDQVESGLIRTYNSNGFPMDVDLQAYFVDSLYNVLDSLITTPNFILLKSGIVNSTTGRVTSSTATTYDATFNKTRLQNLKNAKNLILQAKASTTNAGATNVKIYSDYKLDFKLGVQLQLHIQAKQ